MQPSPDAIAYEHDSTEIDASPEAVYALVSDVTRMGEWSPEATGAKWLRGGTGQAGDWFEGANKSGDRQWSRECEVAVAEPAREFTFVVLGVEANCTWWSYEIEPTDSGCELTERWWVVNKTKAVAGMTAEQFGARVAHTRQMLASTLAAIKVAAELS